MASDPVASDYPDDDVPWEGVASHEKQTGWVYPFEPHPKQKLASEYDVDELLFGGAAGPGKLIGHWQKQ